MKKFILRLMCFVVVVIILISIGILLPATKRESKSLIFSKKAKDELLSKVVTPRIIFIGGSNLSFGLNSQLIYDSLKIFPINTGIQASIGVIFMMDDVLKYLKPGDVEVIVPEYSNYYGRFAYGSEELLRTVLDLYPLKKVELRKEQWVNIFKFIPKYAFSKFNPKEYFWVKENKIYGVQSFNKYGDVNAHWKLEKEQFEPIQIIKGELNKDIFIKINDFSSILEQKGIRCYISFPAFQKTSYKNCKQQIIEIEKNIIKYNIKSLGTAERYVFDDSLMFNKPYHLTKKGLDLRTQFLIEDLKVALK